MHTRGRSGTDGEVEGYHDGMTKGGKGYPIPDTNNRI